MRWCGRSACGGRRLERGKFYPWHRAQMSKPGRAGRLLSLARGKTGGRMPGIAMAQSRFLKEERSMPASIQRGKRLCGGDRAVRLSRSKTRFGRMGKAWRTRFVYARSVGGLLSKGDLSILEDQCAWGRGGRMGCIMALGSDPLAGLGLPPRLVSLVLCSPRFVLWGEEVWNGRER